MSGWRFGTGQSNQMGLSHRVEFDGCWWYLASFASEGFFFALLNEALPNSHAGASVDIENVGDVGIGSTSIRVGFVGQKADAGVKDLLGRRGTVFGEFEESIPLSGREPDVVLVTGLLWRLDAGHD